MAVGAKVIVVVRSIMSLIGVTGTMVTEEDVTVLAVVDFIVVVPETVVLGGVSVGVAEVVADVVLSLIHI